MVPSPSPAPDSEIKTMKLYSSVERIENELRKRGIELLPNGDGGIGGDSLSSSSTFVPLDPKSISSVDSMHYEGDDAVYSCIERANVGPASVLLDVGSGFGGPARLLAERTGCDVVALEMQGDVHETAEKLTASCDLGDGTVRHVRGDFLTCDWEELRPLKIGSGRVAAGGEGGFDAVVSWLVFLHIADKTALLGRCASALRPGGRLFVEDYYRRGPFSEEEVSSLHDDVYCSDLPSREEYVGAVEEAGFESVVFEDVTDRWTAFVRDRLEKFVANQESFEATHGSMTFHSLLHFYRAVVQLFEGGHLGGVRLCATRSGD